MAGTAALLLSAVAEARRAARVTRRRPWPVSSPAWPSSSPTVRSSFLGSSRLLPCSPWPAPRERTSASAVVAAVADVGVIGVTALLGHDPIAAARTALAIHRETYTRPRSYALWLPFNLLDLVALRRPARGRCVRPPVARSPRPRRRRGLAVLLLSGATRGEVGRIWIPLMPFVLWVRWRRSDSPSLRDAAADRRAARRRSTSPYGFTGTSDLESRSGSPPKGAASARPAARSSAAIRWAISFGCRSTGCTQNDALGPAAEEREQVVVRDAGLKAEARDLAVNRGERVAALEPDEERPGATSSRAPRSCSRRFISRKSAERRSPPSRFGLAPHVEVPARGRAAHAPRLDPVARRRRARRECEEGGGGRARPPRSAGRGRGSSR